MYLAQGGDKKPSKLYVGKTYLTRTSTTRRRAGDYYTMHPGALHRIVRTGGGFTASLVCCAAPARHTNRLIVEAGRNEPLIPRYLEINEVARILRELVAHLTTANNFVEGNKHVHRH